MNLEMIIVFGILTLTVILFVGDHNRRESSAISELPQQGVQRYRQ